MSDRAEVTMMLQRAADGDALAQHELAPLVYEELKGRAQALMRRESRAHSLQATVLVNDAFLRLIQAESVDWQSRTHFYALASKVMRQVLVEHARARARQKRGGDVKKVSLDDALMVGEERDQLVLDVDRALEKLTDIDARQAEIVTLRFFGGMSMDDVAEHLGISKRTAEREWTLVKAWLRRELAG